MAKNNKTPKYTNTFTQSKKERHSLPCKKKKKKNCIRKWKQSEIAQTEKNNKSLTRNDFLYIWNVFPVD